METPWTVTGQTQALAKDTTGVYVPVVRVSFMVGNLGPFAVEVPVNSFSPEAVRPLIADYTSHVLAVQNMA